MPLETTPLLTAQGSDHDHGSNGQFATDTHDQERGETHRLAHKGSSSFLPWLPHRSGSTSLSGRIVGFDRSVRGFQRHIIRSRSSFANGESEENVIDTAFKTHAVYGPEPTFRERLSFFMDTSLIGRWWEVMDCALNAMFAGIYIWITSYGSQVNVPGVWLDIDLIIAFLILGQWIPRYYLSLDERVVTNPINILTMLSTIPVILDNLYFRYGLGSILDPTGDLLVAMQQMDLLYSFRFWRLYNTTKKVLKPSRNVLFRFSDVTMKGISISLTIFSLLLTVSGFVHVMLRRQGQDLEFWDVFYWIFVTSSSGLSTRIVIDSWLSRLVIVFVMINGIVFLPAHLTEFIELIRTRSKYVHSYKTHADHDHVILIGDLEINSVRDFLREFFCEDHGPSTMSCRVVILHPTEPSEELKNLLGDPLYSTRVKYIKGSTIRMHDLEKAKAQSARACFIMNSNFTDRRYSEVDAEAVMRAISLKKHAKDTNLLVQVILPPNKLHFDSLAEHVLCLDEFKLGILAQNCISPGFITLVNILVSSVPDSSIRGFKSKYNAKKGGAWATEYVNGLNKEIYPVVLSDSFRGMKFKAAAERIFLRHNAILFGLGAAESDWKDVSAGISGEEGRKGPRGRRGVRINPSNYVLSGGEEAYIIARDAFSAENVARNNEEWMYEPCADGDMEWERQWDFEELVDVEEDEEEDGFAKKWAKKVSKVAGVVFKKKSRSASDTNADIALLKEGQAGSSQSTQKLDGEPVNENNDDTSNSPMHAEGELVYMGVKGNGLQGGDHDGVNPEWEMEPAPAPIAKDEVVKDPQPSKAALSSPFHIFTSRNKNSLTEKTAPSSPVASSVVLASDPQFLTDHLVICILSRDRFPSSLAFLIAPFRSRYPTCGIVILAAVQPSSELKAKLEAYGSIFFIQGIALDRADLKKCGISTAGRAVVLASANSKGTAADLTADAPALLSVLNIEALAKADIFVTVEFIHLSNMKLIGAGDEYYTHFDVYGHSIMPAYASGHVFSHTMVNTLLVQTYYNPHLLVILKNLIFAPATKAGPLRLESTTSLHDTPEEDENDKTEHGLVFKLKVPKKFIGQKWALLVVRCLRDSSALCLALYRKDEVNGHVVRYVIVSPDNDTRLRRGDSVFLLASSEPVL